MRERRKKEEGRKKSSRGDRVNPNPGRGGAEGEKEKKEEP